ncbi:hypothetical protein F0L17_16750 [Streptomyces sp. TRM43335]|uniref:Uncharacterized protein n=1 Tax=Streptomyces taklimakanensis TaxID=2569853 RepID=A0A6G2BF78_9ACTN|nr:hypothetical protein [Streptomyces taklimakanensis]MTE20729.1 hypothetical protein [Streptomyces taklimakanensis]
MTAQRRRHAREKQARTRRNGAPRALLRVGLTFSAVGATVTGGATAAAAAEPEPLLQASSLTALVSPESLGTSARGAAEALGAMEHATTGALRPAKDHRLHPLAGTGVDPLANSASTRIADFHPVSTEAVTGPISRGASPRELPVAGPVLGLLPG